jgi:hypothetical protein
MRNINWTIIALAILAAAGVFYFVKKSDFMKKQEVATTATEMATSMDDGTAESFEEDEMIGEPTSDEDESVMVFEEEVD